MTSLEKLSFPINTSIVSPSSLLVVIMSFLLIISGWKIHLTSRIKLVEHRGYSCHAIDPDEKRDTVQMISSRGFIPETHYVTTSDGYILALHRIVNPRDQGKKNKKVVYLQHGLIASSSDFIINAPGEGLNDPPPIPTQGRNLGFTLSRLGYDVWLGNIRGNTYCRNHTSLHPDSDRKFWDFTWDQHALIDLPTSIDYVRNLTSSKTIGYVGHSQGTLIMFALLSTKRQYNDIIKPFIALAPIATLGGIRSPVRHLANNSPLIEYFKWRGGQFLPSTEFIRNLAERICESRYVTICTNILFLFSGFDMKQLNTTRLAVYYSHTPAGTSAWNLIHLAQQVKSKDNRLVMFDYGRLGNIEMYGTEHPPEYVLEKITNENIVLMSAQNDWLSDLRDIQILRERLRVPLLMDYVVEDPLWNHLDFLWGIDTGKIINSKIVKILDSFS